MFPESMGWAVVLPVKILDQAKTRLLPANDPARPELALAFLQDVLSALASSSRVARITIVTDDERVQDLIGSTPHHWVAEGGRQGINAAALMGAKLTPVAMGTAIVTADLPCLTSATIDHVLAKAELTPRSFLADTQGLGTTMLMNHPGADCTPEFGVRSRARHTAAGYVEIGLNASADDRRILAPAHRDVDTPVDLWDAMRIGVGTFTRELIANGRNE